MSTDNILQRIANAVIALDQKTVEELSREALASVPPPTIIIDGLSRGMQTIGAQFKIGEVFIPEVMVACDCYYAGLKIVKPHLKPQDDKWFIGKMVVGTIHGDIHTVGKDVAVPVFEAAGFQVVDLGVAVPDEKIVEAVREHQPDIVGLGTYMTPTFVHTKETVRALTEAGLRDRVKVICGGPSVNREAARRMGADDASDNAWEAVEIMRGWMKGREGAAERVAQ
jgi:5-methyltetrahydrofolate--homocysteine methyltransferase